MASENFDRCLTLTLGFEGGYVDNPHDPGGATNLGITRAILAKVRGRPVAKAEVMALTRAEASGIYRRLFWNSIAADTLPLGVDAALFDLSVNSGPGRAIRALQTALKLPVSGRLENSALIAAAAMPAGQVVRAICAGRLSFLQRLKNFSFFGRGWSRRVQAVERAALAMTSASLAAPPSRHSNAGSSPAPKGHTMDAILPNATLAISNSDASKPFWASQTIWSALAVIGSALTGSIVAWKTGDITTFGTALTAVFGGISAIIGRFRATKKIS